MRKCLTLILLTLAMTTTAQNYENQFTRPLHDVMADVEKRFGIRLKYDMDTTGLQVKYADFRIRPYSVEETLSNLLAPLDFKTASNSSHGSAASMTTGHSGKHEATPCGAR